LGYRQVLPNRYRRHARADLGSCPCSDRSSANPHHCAYVVDDIEETVSRLVDQLGAGPFFLIENVPVENVL
jgi:hypothetical protein